jgi:hypothetical protein
VFNDDPLPESRRAGERFREVLIVEYIEDGRPLTTCRPGCLGVSTRALANGLS